MPRPEAAAIDEACHALRLANTEVAALTKLSPRAISDWRLGHRPPSPGNARVLVDAIMAVDAVVGGRLAEKLKVARTAAPPAAPKRDPRAEMEGAVYLAADALGVPARTLRLALAQVLLQARSHGMSLDDAYAALVPSPTAQKPRAASGR